MVLFMIDMQKYRDEINLLWDAGKIREAKKKIKEYTRTLGDTNGFTDNN